MTREEAIMHLCTYSTTMGSGQTSDEQHKEAKRMAIEALKAEPTGDLISRQAAIEKLESLERDMENEIEDAKKHPENYTKNFIRYVEEQVVGVAYAAHEIIDMPSAEPVHGEWAKETCIDWEDGARVKSVYVCPNCGAKMLTKESPENLSLKADGEAVSKGGETE